MRAALPAELLTEGVLKLLEGRRRTHGLVLVLLLKFRDPDCIAQRAEEPQGRDYPPDEGGGGCGHGAILRVLKHGDLTGIPPTLWRLAMT